jgi:hypothetical protein
VRERERERERGSCCEEEEEDREREKSDLGEDRGLVSRREIREEERWLQWE